MNISQNTRYGFKWKFCPARAINFDTENEKRYVFLLRNISKNVWYIIVVSSLHMPIPDIGPLWITRSKSKSKSLRKSLYLMGNILMSYINKLAYSELQFITFKPSLAKHDMPCLSKQCRSRLLKKPTDLDLHCLSLNMCISIKNPDQVIWLAGNYKWAWYLNLFSMTGVNLLCNIMVFTWQTCVA